MTTLYALLLDLCGLSHREAAAFHGVRLDTVKSWSAGRNRAPENVIKELVGLSARIDKAAGEALAQMAELASRHGLPEEIELGLAADDHEAQAIGWPCVGAQRACLARVVAAGMAKGYRFRVVPRGATAATAAAADAHEGRSLS